MSAPPLADIQVTIIETRLKTSSMKTAWKRTAAVALIAFPVSGCTFGMLKTNKCLELYGPGLLDAASQARSRGAISEESYGFCVDGRARAEAMLPSLQAHGFRTSGPSKHFEVPGGWCLSGTRPASSERFDPMRSLEAVCAIGHVSRAYLTGGTLRTSDGEAHHIRSTYDREADERLERRLPLS
jgi:hypothetical protein